VQCWQHKFRVPKDDELIVKMIADIIWELLKLVRAMQPLIHNITNFVVMNNTANALLSLGASPAMIHSIDEVEDFVNISQALVVNIGTLYSEQIAACKLAVIRAVSINVPWILDPVGAGSTPYRMAAAISLARIKPKVIRGNGSEIINLAEQHSSGYGKGVDSLHSSDIALDAAQHLASSIGTTVAITGAVDYVTDGCRVTAIENGHPLMQLVTGLGCSATAMIGAFLAVEEDAFTAAVAGLTVLGIAGEIAAECSSGPGTLQVALLDTLYSLDEKVLKRRCKCKELRAI
jgi:hydroxyethylthiazole kinase